jgi:type III restriction enzyme
MIQRAIPDLMGLKNIVVLNDEVHHCYRSRPTDDNAEDLKGEDKDDARPNNEAARVWIAASRSSNANSVAGGLPPVTHSHPHPYLRGSGYAEGTLFP